MRIQINICPKALSSPILRRTDTKLAERFLLHQIHQKPQFTNTQKPDGKNIDQCRKTDLTNQNTKKNIVKLLSKPQVVSANLRPDVPTNKSLNPECFRPPRICFNHLMALDLLCRKQHVFVVDKAPRLSIRIVIWILYLYLYLSTQ